MGVWRHRASTGRAPHPPKLALTIAFEGSLVRSGLLLGCLGCLSTYLGALLAGCGWWVQGVQHDLAGTSLKHFHGSTT